MAMSQNQEVRVLKDHENSELIKGLLLLSIMVLILLFEVCY